MIFGYRTYLSYSYPKYGNILKYNDYYQGVVYEF